LLKITRSVCGAAASNLHNKKDVLGFEFYKMKLVFVDRIIGVLPLSLSTRIVLMSVYKDLPSQRQLRLDYWHENYGEQNVQRFLGLES
jgi:hypothetical protein